MIDACIRVSMSRVFRLLMEFYQPSIALTSRDSKVCSADLLDKRICISHEDLDWFLWTTQCLTHQLKSLSDASSEDSNSEEDEKCSSKTNSWFNSKRELLPTLLDRLSGLEDSLRTSLLGFISAWKIFHVKITQLLKTISFTGWAETFVNENYLTLTLDEGLGEELSNPFLAYSLFIRIEIIQISFAVDADNKRGY